MGDASVDVTAPGDQLPTPAGTLAVGKGGATRDVTLPPLHRYTVVADVATQAGDGAPVPVLLDEWRVRAHLPTELVVGGTSRRFEGTRYDVVAREGVPGSVCTEGREAGLPRACTPFVFGSADEVRVRVLLSEGDELVAPLLTSAGRAPSSWSAHVYREEASGLQWNATRSGSGPLRLQGLLPGRYDVVVWAAGEQGRAAGLVVAAGSGRTELDPVRLSPPSDLLDRGQARLAISSREPRPGALLDVQVGLQLYRPAPDAVLELALPAGATVVAAQASGRDLEVPATVGGVARLPLGQIYAYNPVSRRLQVRLGPDSLVDAPLVATLVDGEVRAEVGRALLDVGGLTLVAPASTATRELALSGRGPVGREVSLAADGQPLGSAVVGPGGLWRTRVTLPEGGRRTVSLTAVSRAGDSVLAAPATPVLVDTSEPVLETMTVEQTDGRKVSWSPSRDGVARFPYVFVPSQPTHFTLAFDRPDRVTGVRVVLEGKSEPAVEQADGTWAVDIQSSRFGAIEAWWRTVPTPVASLASLPEPPTADQGRALLPDGLKDWVLKADDDDTSTTVTLPALAEGTATPTVTVSSTIERGVAYTPTAEEQLLADLSGTGVYGFAVERTRGATAADGTYGETVTVSGYVDEALLSAAAPSLRGRTALRARATAGKTFAKWKGKVDFKDLKEKYDTNKERFDDLKEIWDGFKALDERMSRLEHLLAKSQQCPPDAAPKVDLIEPQIEALKKGIATSKVGVVTMKALSKVELKGPSFLDKLPDLFDSAQTVVWNYKIGQLEALLDDCPEPPEPDGSSSSSSSSSSSGGSGSGSGESGGAAAAATPIYDPSGYLYEGVPSNRVEGATAVLSVQQADLSWVPWDAGWFEQENPQTTDARGRYGWDVPEGLWRVDYVKDGYAPARSAELRVLPPHFDVNISMVSTVPAAVSSATHDDGTLLLRFDRPVQVASALEDGRLSVRRGTDAVAGTWAAVSPEADPKRPEGGTRAAAFRFTPSAALAGGRGARPGRPHGAGLRRASAQGG